MTARKPGTPAGASTEDADVSAMLRRERSRIAAHAAAWRALRPEVRHFATEMELALRRNDHKLGWKHSAAPPLLLRAHEELGELHRAALRYEARGHKRHHARTVTREAADVANCAMMVADVCGGLPPLDDES